MVNYFNSKWWLQFVKANWTSTFIIIIIATIIIIEAYQYICHHYPQKEGSYLGPEPYETTRMFVWFTTVYLLLSNKLIYSNKCLGSFPFSGQIKTNEKRRKKFALNCSRFVFIHSFIGLVWFIRWHQSNNNIKWWQCILSGDNEL